MLNMIFFSNWELVRIQRILVSFKAILEMILLNITIVHIKHKELDNNSTSQNPYLGLNNVLYKNNVLIKLEKKVVKYLHYNHPPTT